MKICFFAHVAELKLLELMEWYRQDIRILQDIGFDVHIATKFREIPWDCEFYFSWWCTGSVLPLIVARVKRKPLIILGYGSEVVNSTQGLGYRTLSIPGRVMVQTSLRLADVVLSISSVMSHEANRLVPREYLVIHLALDTDFFCRGWEANAPHPVLTISHLNRTNMERKALKSIIQAIPSVLKVFPDQQFVMAGSHMDAYEELFELAQSCKIINHISFPGRISNNEKLRLLQNAAIYLQPTRHEGFGMAIVEAMSCGAPVITSRSGSVPEVTGDYCIYANPDDPESIADQITLLLEDRVLANNISETGRKWALENYSISKRRNAIVDLLRSKFAFRVAETIGNLS